MSAKKQHTAEQPSSMPRLSGIAEAAALAGRTTAIEQAVAAAQEHWNAGQNQQAEILCQQALLQAPGYAPALHLLGLIAHSVDKLTEAIGFLRGACAAAGAPALYHSNFAELCRLDGRLDEAERAARRALELDADNVGAQGNLGIILQEAGKLNESLILLREATRRDPGNAEMCNNLANTLQRAGFLLEAKATYLKAVELNPEYDTALANLSHLLVRLGELDAGHDAAQQAVDINPQCAAAYLSAASIHLKRGQLPQALRRIDALLNFMPSHAQALHLRAALLIEADEFDDAEQFARQALALTPTSAEAVLVLGRVLEKQGRIEEALKIYRSAGQIEGSGKDEVSVAHAGLLIELGHQQEARALLLDVLTRQPHSAAAWLKLSTIKKFCSGDPDMTVMQTALEQGGRNGQSLEDRIGLHFALGKALLDSGDAVGALDQYDQANGLQRTLVQHDAESSRRWMASIPPHIPRALLESMAAGGAGDASDVPVFIIGMPRSGTTLVEQILASHPDVFGAGELGLLQTMVDSIVGEDDEPLPYPSSLSRLDADDFDELGAYYAGHVAALGPGKLRVVDKMPLNFLYAGLIHLMLPNARIIHVRRDPVDTCMSCYCQPFDNSQKFTFELAELGSFYGAYRALMRHWREILPCERFLEVDYEDIVADLDSNARKLVRFCGLGWDDACLEFHRTSRRVSTASMAQVRQPIYGHSIGRWAAHAERLAPLYEALKNEVTDG